MRRPSRATVAVRQRLETLDRDLEAPLETDAEGLHRVRVATRRLREALPLFVPANGSAALVTDLTHVMRGATRALGDLREIDVALSLVEGLATERPDLQPALDLIRAGMTGERAARVQRLRRRLDADRLRRASHSFAQQLEQSVDDTRATELLAERLRGRIEDLRRSVSDAGLLYAPERLHRIRLAVKKLRYALELAGDMRAAATKRLVTELRRTQDCLGLLHDLETVARLARRTLAQAPAPESAGAALSLLEAKIRAQHAAYLAHRWQLVALIDRATAVRERVRRRRSRPPRPAQGTGRSSVAPHGRSPSGRARS